MPLVIYALVEPGLLWQMVFLLYYVLSHSLPLVPTSVNHREHACQKVSDVETRLHWQKAVMKCALLGLDSISYICKPGTCMPSFLETTLLGVYKMPVIKGQYFY